MSDDQGDGGEGQDVELDFKAQWRRALQWDAEAREQRKKKVRDELLLHRQLLNRELSSVERELGEVSGRADWTQRFKSLKALEWLRASPAKQRVLLSYNAHCAIPLGKVGFFVGEGGVGKSWALTQLAISVCTGRRWLDHFQVEPEAVGGVVMIMGEEDPDEMHRRVHHIVSHFGLEAGEASDLERRMWPLPLAGHFIEFLEEGERSELFDRFEQQLRRKAPEGGWKLIVLDPASRFMGVDAEKDNALATRFVQLLERLTELPGNPTVLCAHHTNKSARGPVAGAGLHASAARGASALTDGARWQGNLMADWDESEGQPREDMAIFQVSKSNYGPKPPAIYLQRQAGSGVLVATGLVEDGRPEVGRSRAIVSDQSKDFWT